MWWIGMTYEGGVLGKWLGLFMLVKISSSKKSEVYYFYYLSLPPSLASYITGVLRDVHLKEGVQDFSEETRITWEEVEGSDRKREVLVEGGVDSNT